MQTFLNLTGAPQWLRVWAEARWEAGSGKWSPQLSAKTVLLTYNGDFGDLPVEAYLPLVDLDTTCGQLRMDPTVRQLWADHAALTQLLSAQLEANLYSVVPGAVHSKASAWGAPSPLPLLLQQ